MAQGLAHLSFRCTECGSCCERFRVPLTACDIARLVQATGQAAERFVEWLTPAQLDMTGEPASFLELSEGRRIAVLAHAERGCVFLVNKRCSVYTARPTSCAAYPFHAELGKRQGIRRLHLLDMSDCEAEWDGNSAQRDVANTTRRLNRELQAHYASVAAFNRKQRRRRTLGKPLLSAAEWLRGLLVPGAELNGL